MKSLLLIWVAVLISGVTCYAYVNKVIGEVADEAMAASVYGH